MRTPSAVARGSNLHNQCATGHRLFATMFCSIFRFACYMGSEAQRSPQDLVASVLTGCGYCARSNQSAANAQLLNAESDGQTKTTSDALLVLRAATPCKPKAVASTLRRPPKNAPCSAMQCSIALRFHWQSCQLKHCRRIFRLPEIVHLKRLTTV